MHSPVRFLRVSIIVAAAIVPLILHGQTEDDWNHFGVDFRLGLNIKAKFGNLGAFAGPPAPPLSGGVDHNYSDGFVRLDSSGDRGGLTWNWGYQNASQVSGGNLLLHTLSSAGASSSVNDDPRLGVELNYARDIGRLASGRWGFKASLGFTELKIRDSQALSGQVNLITDAYSLGGITAPRAPYNGSFSGPGPVIGDTPARSTGTLAAGASIEGFQKLDAWLYDFRFGPYLHLPLTEGLALQAGGGLALGITESTFSFSDAAHTSAGTVQAAGAGNRTGSMVGFYGEAGLAYELVQGASIFGGGQFQYLGEFNQNVDGRTAQVDLRHSIYFVVGVTFDF